MAESLIKINGKPLWDNSIPGIGSLGYTERYKPNSGAINMKFEALNNGGTYYLPFCKDGSTIEGWTKLSDSLRITKDNFKYVPYRKLQKVTLSSDMIKFENYGATINRSTGEYDWAGSTLYVSNVSISKEFADDFIYWAVDWDEYAFNWGINVTLGAWKGVSTAFNNKTFHNFWFGDVHFGDCKLRATRNGDAVGYYKRFPAYWADLGGKYDSASCLGTDGDAYCTQKGGLIWTIPNALTTDDLRYFTRDVVPLYTVIKTVAEKHSIKYSSGSGSTYKEWYEYYYTATTKKTQGRVGYWHCYF